jgi:tol-pal system protein YbgF
LLVVGCAAPTSALRDDNRRLTQTVTELRTDRRTQDRKLRDLQHQLDDLHATGAMAAVPVLPVEVAAPPSVAAAPAPDAARVVGVTEDGTEIVYEGDAAAGRSAALPVAGAGAPSGTTPGAFDDDPPAPPAPRRTQRAAAASPVLAEVPTATDRIEVTRRVPPISARAAIRSKTREHDAPGDRSGDAAGEYRAAVELVKAGKPDDAIAALRAFITRHPRHDYADNAQYWIGEAYYAQRDYVRALTGFRAVIEVYPRGNKVPDALLKMGYCYAAMGQGEKAHAVLEQVVTRYPKSEPATLAAKRLETP